MAVTTVSDPIADAVALHDRALAAWDDLCYRETANLCRRALDLLERHAGAHHPDVANVLSLLGSAEDELGAQQSAERHHRRAVAVMGAVAAATGQLLRLRVAVALGLVGNLRRRGRYAEAEQLGREALALAEPDYDDLELASIHNELGVLYKFAGRLDDADACYQRAQTALVEAYGVDHPALAPIWHNLAGLAHSRGEFTIGEVYARRSLALYRLTLPSDHPTVVTDEAHLGAMLLAQGKLDEAEPLLRRAVAFFSKRYGPQHHEVLVHLHNLAAVLAERGDLQQAEAMYRHVLEAKRRALGADHPDVALTLNNLAAVVSRPLPK